MAILVCGGAGYIGSHTVYQLVKAREEVVIVDNLQTGHRGAINPTAKFYQGDIRDAKILDKIFIENKIEAVIHFAAFIEAGEIVEKPLKYFNNNVYGMQILLESMVRMALIKLFSALLLLLTASRKNSLSRKTTERNQLILMANPN